MKLLFDQFSSRTSKIITEAYSTSFSLGILYINKKIRNDIYSIYGFVRVADEIVDSFDGYDKKSLLESSKPNAGSVEKTNFYESHFKFPSREHFIITISNMN